MIFIITENRNFLDILSFRFVSINFYNMKEIEFKGEKGAFKKLMNVFREYEIAKTLTYILKIDRITFAQTIIFANRDKNNISVSDIEKLKTLVEKFKQ